MMSILLNGWPVAWPPGPVNAEMIRRGLLPCEQRRRILGHLTRGTRCTGDFLWALSVAAGTGVLLNKPGVRTVLGLISLALLLILATIFSVSAWKTAHRSLMLACAVVLGAITWTIVLCVAVRSGARIFARPVWQIWTQALTAAVMIFFAAKLAFRLFG